MKILISIPNLHWIHKHVVHTIMLLQKDGRYNLSFIMPSHKPYENNLHHIIVDFLKSDCAFWLNIDSDNPPIKNPLDLIQLDRDIIGLPTPVWHYTGKRKKERPIYWNAYDYVKKDDAYKEHIKREGLQEVDAIGTGCFLIARRVFKNKNLQKGAFTRKLYPDGTVNKGNDMSFCERAKDEGFKIFCHYDYPCNHFSELELNEVSIAIKGML